MKKQSNAVKGFLLLIILCLVLTMSAKASELSTEIIADLPVKDTVTLLDFGATTCIPCKLMAPILEELKQEYKGRAEVIFINVYDEANAGKAQAFKVMGIPTQIFYDRHGKEVFRHMGFLDKKSIVAKLEELLGE